jgi:hypothetical protein
MSDPKLEAMRAAILAENERKNGKSFSSSGDNASYPFYEIPETMTAITRFVPDKDDNNPFFFVPRLTCKISFSGIDGGDYPTDNPVTVTVPCVEMFGDVCPIISHTKSWWKDVDGAENPMKETARRYYKKKSFIASGFVVSSPFEEASVPENPLRRFIFGPSLMEKIKTGLTDPDMEHNPTDYLNGCDFRIRKTKKQNYNNYDTSEWARRSRALTETEQLAIEKYGLYDLKTYLGTRPDADGIAMIKAMFMASLDGEPFDYASFGAHYRPYGGGRNNEAADAHDSAVKQPTQQRETAKTVSPVVEAAAVETALAGKASDDLPQDLIATLRARSANRNS